MCIKNLNSIKIRQRNVKICQQPSQNVNKLREMSNNDEQRLKISTTVAKRQITSKHVEKYLEKS